MSRPFRIEINVGALQHNLKQIRKLASNSKILAIVKANAYGHGLSRIAHALVDVEALGVSCTEEAIYLRQEGINKKIVLLEGLFSPYEWPLLEKLNLDTVVRDWSQLEFFLQYSFQHPVNIWIKINTGMNRLGFRLEDFQKAYTLLKNNKHIKNIYLMSHFSHSEMENVHVTAQQTQRFEHAIHGLTEESSLANSAAVLAWSQTHKSWIRPGIALYGVSPFPNRRAAQDSLLPVMTLKSEIITINNVKKGESIGYRGEWTCPEDMRIGVVAAGYGDGYPRNAPSGMPVLLNDKVVQLIGKVSMDMLTLDLRTQPHAKVGDSVTLWGDGLPLEEVAESAFLSPYELLCGVNRGELLRTKIEEKTNATPY